MDTNNTQTATTCERQAECCGICRFWKRNNNEAQWGRCRFNPPAAYYESSKFHELGRIPESKTMVWPETIVIDWCGKFMTEPTWQMIQTLREPQAIIGGVYKSRAEVTKEMKEAITHQLGLDE